MDAARLSKVVLGNDTSANAGFSLLGFVFFFISWRSRFHSIKFLLLLLYKWEMTIILLLISL